MQELDRLRNELEKQANVRAGKSEEEIQKELQKKTQEDARLRLKNLVSEMTGAGII